MTEAEKLAVDELLSDIADGNQDGAVARLEALLLNRPDLQRYYCKSSTVLALLRMEYLQTVGEASAVSVMGPIAHAPTSARDSEGRSTRRVWRGRAALAAGCLSACVALTVYSLVGAGYFSEQRRADPANVAAWLSTPAAGDAESGVEVRDRASLQLVGEMTRQPLVTNLVLPVSELTHQQQATLCSGSVWIHRTRQGLERGYLLTLPAGCLVKADVDTDAIGMNSLAVVEIDARGIATGETLVFDNSLAQSSGAAHNGDLCAGRIGSFSKRNTSGATEHYLLTGSHLLTDAEGGPKWFQSDYKIQFDAEGTLVIGWDDSGYAGSEEDAHKFSPDRDFNDMRVVLRFSLPSGAEADGGVAPAVSRYLPASNAAGPEAEGEIGVGYQLDLLPGQEALVSASTDAVKQNGFRLVNAESSRVVWRHDGFPPSPGQSSGRPNDLGVYLVRNTGKTTQRYEVQGWHKPFDGDEASPWNSSPHRTIHADERSRIIGFEDSLGVQDSVDWRDLRVYVRFFSP
ncbi:MAG: hypothetical protein AAGB00_02435 [Planctomycetota bacterium]